MSNPVLNYRSRRRGSLLVVVLGLLVALFIIGTSFSYVTLTERRAAANYLDRQRALDLALDGVEYSIARLRAGATSQHYEGVDESMFEYSPKDRDVEPATFGVNTLDTPLCRASWNRGSTVTTGAIGGTTPDGKWVDFNSDGAQDAGETEFGGDKFPQSPQVDERSFLSSVSLFGGEGICIDVHPPGPKGQERAYPEGRHYTASGTYEELGDIARLKVIDACSQFNLNNFKGQRLKDLLLVLGFEIDRYIGGNNPTGIYNPFTLERAQKIMELHETLNFRFTNKEQLQPLFSDNPTLYDVAMNFVTVRGYSDFQYRDYAGSNNRVDPDNTRNPRKKTDMELQREGYSTSTGTFGGRDGNGDWHPGADTYWRSPVNLNRATKPVLVTLFAGLQARARLMFFKKASEITADDLLQKEAWGAVLRKQVTGTTDLGRQNNQAATPIPEDDWSPANWDNQAVYQLVPIGPITTPGLSGGGSTGTGTDYAGALADLVITERKIHPFTSWQDFDYRVLYRALLNMPAERSGIRVPDMVHLNRSDFTPQDVDGSFPVKYLPRADNVSHPASPLQSIDAAMPPSTFRAWYWKSAVDMIRAALNPNNVVARYNADYPYHQNVDRMDLTTASQPVCFSSMGVYEVISQGELLASKTMGTGIEASMGGATQAAKRITVARRQVRTLVEVYSVMRHTSQRQFMGALDPDFILDGKTPTPSVVGMPAIPENVVANTRYGTKCGPYSIDERTTGNYTETPDSDPTVFSDDCSYIGRVRKKGFNELSYASDEFGYVTLDPQDRTPVLITQTGILNFHARFNEGLNGRSSTAGDGQPIQGLNSKNTADRALFGAYPYDTDAVFDDFINSASPRTKKPALGGEGTSEFAAYEGGDESTRYATLQTDGVFLRGWHLRGKYRDGNGTITSYGQRGFNRPGRLKILRYPCGAKRADNPLDDIEDGPKDSDQTGAGTTLLQVFQRLNGIGPYFSGTDEHNHNVQADRQARSNVPYYEGTIDFWIKWDLPAQGSENYIVSMGEVDPASHNFSGLFSSTCFGRFVDSATYKPAGATRDDKADFEGVQFCIFKEPAGILRFSRLYFSEAWGMQVQGSQYAGGQLDVFGNVMRRIMDSQDNGGINQYTGTGDICIKGDANDKGFRYARADAWVDLTTITSMTIKPLRAHDWHRVTIAYNSNTDTPYRLWLDGRLVTVEFHADTEVNNPKGFVNDGHKWPGDGQDMAPTSEFDVARSACRILEINPEDRLTIGCIFRRQLNVNDQQMFDKYFVENPDSANDKPPRPLFKFDANFIAVANATIDDFRICSRLPDPGYEVDTTSYRAASRYVASTGLNPDTYFEQGFVAQSGGQEPIRLPTSVRLGSLSWTEYRPDWDPYDGMGLNHNKSARLLVTWAIFPNIRDLKRSGFRHDYANASVSGEAPDFTGVSVESDNYWARGGIALGGKLLPAGDTVGAFIYRVYFACPDGAAVSNVTAYLDDMTLTMLTPPRKLVFNVEY